LIVAILVLSSICCAADIPPCKIGTSHVVGHADGVSIYRVSVPKSSGGEVSASAFIPDSQEPVPGIIFTHSAIQGLSARTDLLRFASALARAGAASIVLDGTIEWLTPNEDFKKPEAWTLACAGQWLFVNTKLDRERLAIAGPQNILGGHPPLCF